MNLHTKSNLQTPLFQEFADNLFILQKNDKAYQIIAYKT